MSVCTPKIKEVNYKDESWWRNFFENDLPNFYSSLKGFVNAYDNLLNELDGDLDKILADNSKRDLFLSIILGGAKKECVDDIKFDNNGNSECLPPNSLANFYRNVIGIGLNEANLNIFINRVKLTGDIIKAGNGLKLEKIKRPSENLTLPDILKKALEVTEEIYERLDHNINKPNPEQIKISKADDLVNLLINTINHGIKLLPLYNPFTFFIQSLRSVPKPYLKLMYCDDILTDNSVKEIMSKYRIELIELLEPDLEGYNDELAIIGHNPGSVGDLLVQLITEIYDSAKFLAINPFRIKVENERIKYIQNYQQYLEDFLKYIGKNRSQSTNVEGKFITSTSSIISLKFYNIYNDGSIYISDTPEFKGNYLKFIEIASPALFLNLAWISKNNYGTFLYYYW